MTTYTVTAERGQRNWVLQCVEVPGAISEAARLDQADVIKEAIAWVADVPEDSIEIVLQPVLPEAARVHMTQAEELRRASAEANRRAAEEARAAALGLADAGLSVRDIGSVMGVSHQRAQQLVTEARAS